MRFLASLIVNPSLVITAFVRALMPPPRDHG